MGETKPLEHHAVEIMTAVMGLLIFLALLSSLLRFVPNLYGQFLGWLQSWHLGAFPLLLMILFILLDALLVGFIAFTIRRYSELVSSKPHTAAPVAPVNPAAEIQLSWKNIERLIESQSQSDWNMAILQADALLDNTLKNVGYAGATMADRLKVADPNQLPSLDRVWSSHRLRNAIAHDPTDQHNRETIISAVNSYRAAFRDLGFITDLSPDTPIPGDAPDNLQFQ
ncbi:MAG: hypothetical protein HY617_02475 [Candidatus Sungbacteria bacterium]|nr:hypothetical protein [Candidatus Sungbacteria bacterium]